MLIFCSCGKNLETEDSILTGTVKNLTGDEIIHPAYIILDDDLLAISDEDGTYEISSLEAGIYSLLCSSVDYSDLSMQVGIEEGKTVYNDFLLSPDDSKGRIYGEFHDKTLYEAQLITNPSMADWSGKELHDGVSGATLQTMTFGNDLPSSEIYVGDSLFALTDGFGQYWFDIQCGTYPLIGAAKGYIDTLHIVSIRPETRIYANFILTKK